MTTEGARKANVTRGAAGRRSAAFKAMETLGEDGITFAQRRRLGHGNTASTAPPT